VVGVLLGVVDLVQPSGLRDPDPVPRLRMGKEMKERHLKGVAKFRSKTAISWVSPEQETPGPRYQFDEPGPVGGLHLRGQLGEESKRNESPRNRTALPPEFAQERWGIVVVDPCVSPQAPTEVVDRIEAPPEAGGAEVAGTEEGPADAPLIILRPREGEREDHRTWIAERGRQSGIIPEQSFRKLGSFPSRQAVQLVEDVSSDFLQAGTELPILLELAHGPAVLSGRGERIGFAVRLDAEVGGRHEFRIRGDRERTGSAFREEVVPARHVADISGEGRLDKFLRAAIEEARRGLAEGGIPIGSVLVIGDRIVGRGRNRRVQKGSAILHAEMDCLENAGRLQAKDYRRSVLYSTLSPCDMCSGTALLYGIPRVVIGENRTFRGPEAYVRRRGVQLEIVNDSECIAMMRDFIAGRPELWNEDIGE